MIRKGSLEYDVEQIDGHVVKKPHESFEYKVERDAKICNMFPDLIPETCYDAENNHLIQRFIDGRDATSDELETVADEVRKHGIIPRGLLEHDVIVDKNDRAWLIDVGNFEILPEARHKFQETKYLYCRTDR